jgi:DNA-binding response OmpR family regulator
MLRSARELLARVKALFRRLEKPAAKQHNHEYGGIALEVSRYEFTYNGKRIS